LPYRKKHELVTMQNPSTPQRPVPASASASASALALSSVVR